MSLENKKIFLNVVNRKGVGFGFMHTTVGEIVNACKDKRCPFGHFSCPISKLIPCEDVTADMWAEALGIREED